MARVSRVYVFVSFADNAVFFAVNGKVSRVYVCLSVREGLGKGVEIDGQTETNQSLGKGTKTRAILRAKYFYFLSDSIFLGQG